MSDQSRLSAAQILPRGRTNSVSARQKRHCIAVAEEQFARTPVHASNDGMRSKNKIDRNTKQPIRTGFKKKNRILKKRTGFKKKRRTVAQNSSTGTWASKLAPKPNILRLLTSGQLGLDANRVVRYLVVLRLPSTTYKFSAKNNGNNYIVSVYMVWIQHARNT